MLSLVLNVIRPQKGHFQWFQGDPVRFRQSVGSLLEGPIYFPDFNAVRNLQLLNDIKGFAVSSDELHRTLRQVGLGEALGRPLKSYSLGMRQRYGLACALLGDPEVLVLDEPTNGMDPQGIADIRQLINSLSQQGKTIILASHMLDEVEKTCTHVAILNEGELMESGPISEVLSGDQFVEVQMKEPSKEVEEVLSQADFIKKFRREGAKYQVSMNPVDPARLNEYLVRNNLSVMFLNAPKGRLEDYYLKTLSRSSPGQKEESRIAVEEVQ